MDFFFIFFLNKQEKLPSVEEKLQASKGAEELRFQAMVNSVFSYRKSWVFFLLYQHELIQILFFNLVSGTCFKSWHLLLFCFIAERHTSLLCSTLERARRTSAPSCLTARAVRPLKTLCLDLDGRCRHPCPQINIPSTHTQICTVATRPRLMFHVLLRWTSLHTVASWVDSRGMAAQVLQHLTTLPPLWKPSFTCLHACHLIPMTA